LPPLLPPPPPPRLCRRRPAEAVPLLHGPGDAPTPNWPMVQLPPAVARGSSHEVGGPPRLEYRLLRCAAPRAAGPGAAPPATPPSAAAPTDTVTVAVTATAAAVVTVAFAAVSSCVTALAAGLETLKKSSTFRPPGRSPNGGAAGGGGGAGVGAGTTRRCGRPVPATLVALHCISGEPSAAEILIALMARVS